MKQCSKCGQLKDEIEFSKDRTKKDDLRNRCKKCSEQYNKQYYIDNREKLKQYYIDNREKIKQREKQYYVDNRERMNQYEKQYYVDNREKIKQRMKQYDIGNKDKIRQRKKQYNLNNKDKIRQYNQSKARKESDIKKLAKRRRNLNWIPLMNNPFPNDIPVDYHHINNLFVIPLPRKTHQSFLGSNHRERGNVIINDLYNLDIGSLLSGGL